MRCLVCSSAQATRWVLALEDAGEEWSVTVATDAAAAMDLLRTGAFDAVIMGASEGGMQLCGALCRKLCSMPPYMISEQGEHPAYDAVCSAAQAERLPLVLEKFRRECRLPGLCPAAMERMTCLASALLHALGVKTSLRAMRFLPDMLALCALHPALLGDLAQRLYPLTARRHGITPSGVERSLRLLVESTWSRVPISALERFFGHSVDPERGKPTNREFLAQLAQRLQLAARRWSG